MRGRREGHTSLPNRSRPEESTLRVAGLSFLNLQEESRRGVDLCSADLPENLCHQPRSPPSSPRPSSAVLTDLDTHQVTPTTRRLYLVPNASLGLGGPCERRREGGSASIVWVASTLTWGPGH